MLLLWSLIKDSSLYKQKDHPEGVTLSTGYCSLAIVAFFLSSEGSEKSVCSAFGREDKGVILLLSTAVLWEDLEEEELDTFWKCTENRLRQNRQKLEQGIFQLDTRFYFYYVSGQTLEQGITGVVESLSLETLKTQLSNLICLALLWARWLN